MSQHLIKELHQLKHEVKMLKEGPGVRDTGVEIDDIKIRLEHIEEKLGLSEPGQPAEVRAKGPRIWRDTRSPERPSSGTPRGDGGDLDR